MSLKEKLTNFFGLTDEEEYLEEQPAYETHYEQSDVAVNQGNTYVRPRSANTAQKSRVTPSQNYRKNYQEQATPQRQQQTQQAASSTEARQSFSRGAEEKVVSMGGPQQRSTSKAAAPKNKAAGKITIIEPRVYSEAMAIAKQIINGDAVLVNFHLIEEYQARRIVDFLTGTVYAEDGDIKRVGDEIFLCTPKGMEIEGTAQSLMDSNFFDI